MGGGVEARVKRRRIIPRSTQRSNPLKHQLKESGSLAVPVIARLRLGAVGAKIITPRSIQRSIQRSNPLKRQLQENGSQAVQPRVVRVRKVGPWKVIIAVKVVIVGSHNSL